MTSLEMVKEFHLAFGHPVKDKPDWDDRTVMLRLNLLSEELDELRDSCWRRPKACALDALCDLQYVLDGAFLALGYHRYKDAAMAEVHRSNMSKLGADGKPVMREDGKVLKGPNYRPPDLESVMREVDNE